MPELSPLQLAIKFTSRWEGGYSNRKADLGGPTNFGITQAYYDDFRKRKKIHKQSVQLITAGERDDIYLEHWTNAKCGSMPGPVAVVVFDTAFNFGVGKAIKHLQRAMHLNDDGAFGNFTKNALAKEDPLCLAMILIGERINHRYQRVKENASQIENLAGWLNRDHELKAIVKGIKTL